MDKILFLNEKDRNTGLSLEHSDYRYKTAKPVAATKPKHDEVGFTIPYAMFRPIREPGLLCELLGDNPVRRTADLKMNFDFLVKDLYENEISRLTKSPSPGWTASPTRLSSTPTRGLPENASDFSMSRTAPSCTAASA